MTVAAAAAAADLLPPAAAAVPPRGEGSSSATEEEVDDGYARQRQQGTTVGLKYGDDFEGEGQEDDDDDDDVRRRRGDGSGADLDGGGGGLSDGAGVSTSMVGPDEDDEAAAGDDAQEGVGGEGERQRQQRQQQQQQQDAMKQQECEGMSAEEEEQSSAEGALSEEQEEEEGGMMVPNDDDDDDGNNDREGDDDEVNYGIGIQNRDEGGDNIGSSDSDADSGGPPFGELGQHYASSSTIPETSEVVLPPPPAEAQAETNRDRLAALLSSDHPALNSMANITTPTSSIDRFHSKGYAQLSLSAKASRQPGLSSLPAMFSESQPALFGMGQTTTTADDNHHPVTLTRSGDSREGIGLALSASPGPGPGASPTSEESASAGDSAGDDSAAGGSTEEEGESGNRADGADDDDDARRADLLDARVAELERTVAILAGLLGGGRTSSRGVEDGESELAAGAVAGVAAAVAAAAAGAGGQQQQFQQEGEVRQVRRPVSPSLPPSITTGEGGPSSGSSTGGGASQSADAADPPATPKPGGRGIATTTIGVEAVSPSAKDAHHDHTIEGVGGADLPTMTASPKSPRTPAGRRGGLERMSSNVLPLDSPSPGPRRRTEALVLGVGSSPSLGAEAEAKAASSVSNALAMPPICPRLVVDGADGVVGGATAVGTGSANKAVINASVVTASGGAKPSKSYLPEYSPMSPMPRPTPGLEYRSYTQEHVDSLRKRREKCRGRSYSFDVAEQLEKQLSPEAAAPPPHRTPSLTSLTEGAVSVVAEGNGVGTAAASIGSSDNPRNQPPTPLVPRPGDGRGGSMPSAGKKAPDGPAKVPLLTLGSRKKDKSDNGPTNTVKQGAEREAKGSSSSKVEKDGGTHTCSKAETTPSAAEDPKRASPSASSVEGVVPGGGSGKKKSSSKASMSSTSATTVAITPSSASKSVGGIASSDERTPTGKVSSGTSATKRDRSTSVSSSTSTIGNKSTVQSPDSPKKSSQKQQKKSEKQSMISYLKSEMMIDSRQQEGSAADDVDANMEEFLRIPAKLERLLFFGFWICTDSFLYVLTFLPIKFAWSCICLAITVIRSGKNVGQCRFHRRHLYQILQMSVVLAVYRHVLVPISIGKLYHWIRGQAMIKLYVLIAIVEVFDRLLCSLGQDALDSLYWNTTRRPYHPRMIVSTLVVFIYATLHSLILFLHIATLNVAMNSSDHALLTLIISGNFAEIKSTVFKKYNKQNLFKITTSDICERFKLALFLTLILILNCFQGGMNRATIMEYFHVCGVVSLAELFADWIKHSFITKFNFINSSAYPDYALILAGDMTGIGHEGINLNHTHAVVKRLGFSQIPLVCVMLRYLSEAMRYAIVFSHGDTEYFLNTFAFLYTEGRWATLTGVMLGFFVLTVVAKIVLGLLLLRSSRRLLDGPPVGNVQSSVATTRGKVPVEKPKAESASKKASSAAARRQVV